MELSISFFSILFYTRCTATSFFADYLFHVLLSVVVGDLVTDCYVLACSNENLVFVFIVLCFAIWFARVIDVSGFVLSSFAVDDKCIGNFEKISSSAFVSFFFSNTFSSVFNNELPLFNGFLCKQSKSCTTSFYFYFRSYESSCIMC